MAEGSARSTKRALGSIVLGFETFVVFFGALAVFGMRLLPVVWVVVALLTILAVLILALMTMPRPIGYALGWGAQVLLAAGGILEWVIALVALVFAAIWGFALYEGGRRDASVLGQHDQ